MEYKNGYLKDSNPKLYKELDPEKNINIDITNLSSKSGIEVWWKCSKCGYSWKKRVVDRFIGKGCPVCSNKKVQKGYNDLQFKYPNLAKEWDYENNDKKPDEIVYTSSYSANWICERGHRWKTLVKYRVSGNNCPICANKKVLKSYNDLQFKYPNLAKEWDYENNDKKPDEILYGSSYKAHWICKKGHRWVATVESRSRNNGNNCPHCAKELRVSFPEKAVAYYLNKSGFEIIESYKPNFLNGKEIDVYIPKLKVGIEYDGERWHKSVAKDKSKDKICAENNIVLYRIREKNCPEYKSSSKKIILLNNNFDGLTNGINTLLSDLKITNINVDLKNDQLNIEEIVERRKKENSFLDTMPELAKEWDYEKNGILRPENYSYKSSIIVWWKCHKCGNSYRMSIKQKSNNQSPCPICSNKRLVLGINDLATTHPELAKEWDYEKNDKKPTEVISNSDRKVYWVCKKGHSYMQTIYARKSGQGCPFCSGRYAILGVNDLATTHPELAKEWDYRKNKTNPSEYKAGSHYNAWWICSKCGYNWEQTIKGRTGGRKCPNCRKNDPKKTTAKSVIQLSKDGKILNKYLSIKDAQKNTGIKHISSVCSGNRKYAGGYIWKYEE